MKLFGWLDRVARRAGQSRRFGSCQSLRDRRERQRQSQARSTEVLEDRTLLSTITVTDLNDGTLAELAGDGEISLREAIEAANTNSSVNGSVAGEAGPTIDVIMFDPGLSGTITLNGTELEISETVRIVGNGRAASIINGNDLSRILTIGVTAGDVTLEDLTLTGGRTFDDNPFVVDEFENTHSGGAIRFLPTTATLTIENSELRDNHTEGEAASGAAIYSDGAVVVANSAISNNSTLGGADGGGIFTQSANITLVNSHLTGNTATDGFGGGLFSYDGDVEISNSTVSGNSTTGLFKAGGGIANIAGPVTVTNSTISGNMTTGPDSYGGGVFVDAGTITITNSTLSGNATTGPAGGGGALFSNDLGEITIRNSTITNNSTAGTTGGLLIVNNRPLTISNSIVAGNTDSGGVADMSDTTALVVTHSLIGAGPASLPAGSPDGSGNLVGTTAAPIDAKLEPLGDNGGTTQTHALKSDSPARDAGDPAFDPSIFTPPMNFDQRGTPFVRMADGDNNGTAVIDMGALEANARPIVDLNGPDPDIGIGFIAGTYNEQDPPRLIVDTDLTVSDDDGNDISGATVVFPGSGNTHRLNVTIPPAITAITKSFDADTRTLTLTGSDTDENYQTVLRTLTYAHEGNIGGLSLALIPVTVTDVNGLDSLAAMIELELAEVDFMPVLDLNGPDPDLGTNNAVNFARGGGLVKLVQADATLTDRDDTTTSQVIVRLDSPTATETLSLTGTVPPEITVTPFDSATGELTLSGLASLDDYRDLLRTLQYNDSNAAAASGVREVTVDVGLPVLPGQGFTSASIDIAVFGITVNETDGTTTVNESGSTDTFTVALDGSPVSDVTVAVTTDDPGEATVAPTSLTFTPANFSTAQTVTVTGVDDAVVDADQVSTVTLSVDGFGPDANRTVSVTTIAILSSPLELDLNGPDPATGNNNAVNYFRTGGPVLIVSPNATLTDADDTTTSQVIVRLASPTTTDRLTLTGTVPAEITVAPFDVITGELALFGNAPLEIYRDVLRTLHYDDADPNAPTAVRELTIEVGDSVASGSGFASANITISVFGFDIADTDGSTRVEESGTIDTITVALDGTPVSDVIVSVTSTNLDEQTSAPAELTFTSANARTPQTVTITGADDDRIDGDIFSVVTMSFVGAGSDSSRSVIVTTIDDDVAGIAVDQRAESVLVRESGEADTFGVTLTAEPESNVVLSVEPLDNSELSAAPTTLTFTPENWDVPQNVTVTGVGDTVADGDSTTSIRLSVVIDDSDTAFADVTSIDVSAVNVDDDAAGVVVTATDGSTIVSETGTTDTIDVVLSAEPLGIVVLNVSSKNTNEVTASPATLTFTPDDWDVAQTIEVTGVPDGRDDGDRTVPVQISVNAAASHESFASVLGNTVLTTNLDDDPTPEFDFDDNGQADPLSDAVLLVRFLAGFTGNSLVDGVVDATDGKRISSDEIQAFLDRVGIDTFDVDGDGKIEPLSDGIVILRFLAGFTGDALVQGAVNPNGTRTGTTDIEEHLFRFLPPVALDPFGAQLHFTTEFDIHSPQLANALATGTVFETVEVSVVHPNETAPVTTQKWQLKNVALTSFDVFGGALRPLSAFSLRYDEAIYTTKFKDKEGDNDVDASVTLKGSGSNTNALSTPASGSFGLADFNDLATALNQFGNDASGSIFIRFPTIDGTATTDGFTGQIPVVSFGQSVAEEPGAEPLVATSQTLTGIEEFQVAERVLGGGGGDYLVRFDGIRGEDINEARDNEPNWVAISSFFHSIDNVVLSAGRPSPDAAILHPLQIVGQFGAHSPKLREHLVSGEPIPRIELVQVVEIGDSSRESLKIELTDVRVVAYDQAAAGARSGEAFSLQYGGITETFLPQKENGSEGTPVSFTRQAVPGGVAAAERLTAPTDAFNQGRFGLQAYQTLIDVVAPGDASMHTFIQFVVNDASTPRNLIQGDVLMDGYRGFIEVGSFTHSVSLNTDDATVDFGNLNFTTLFGQHSPKMVEALTDGRVFDSVRLVQVRSGRDGLTEFYSVELDNVLIVSWDQAVEAGGRPGEAWSLSFDRFEETYTRRNPNDTIAGRIGSRWQRPENDKVAAVNHAPWSGLGGYQVLQNVVASAGGGGGVTYFAKIDGIAGSETLDKVEGLTANPQGWIALRSWGQSIDVTELRGAALSVTDMQFVADVGIHSPRLLQLLTDGRTVASLIVVGVNENGDRRVRFHEIRLDNVTFASHDVVGPRVGEAWSVRYGSMAQDFIPVDESGDLQGPLTFDFDAPSERALSTLDRVDFRTRQQLVAGDTGNFNVFLKVPGVEGDATANKFEKQIQVGAFGQTIQHFGVGTADDNLFAGELQIVSTVGIHSPLLQELLNNRDRQDMELTVTKISSIGDPGLVAFYEILVKGGVVTSYEATGSGGEAYTIAYTSLTYRFTPENNGGGSQTPVEFTLDVPKPISLTSGVARSNGLSEFAQQLSFLGRDTNTVDQLFAKFETSSRVIRGAVNTDGFKDQVELTDFAWSIQRSITSRFDSVFIQSSLAESELRIGLPTGLHSAALVTALRDGTQIQKLTISRINQVRRADGDKFVTVEELILENVLVTAWDQHTADGNRSGESFQLRFKKMTRSFTPQKQDGTLDTAQKKTFKFDFDEQETFLRAPGSSTSSGVVTSADLQPLIDQAIAGYVAAGVDAAAFDDVRFEVQHLSGTTLGLAFSDRIVIDADAAGFGWFIDTTPDLDEEFANGLALHGTAATGRLDLLTAITHELGHLLGLEHSSNTDSPMFPVLLPGQRERITAADLNRLDDAFASDLLTAQLLHGSDR